MNNVILLNPFEIPKGTEEEVLSYWEEAAQLMRRAPGYISTALHRAIDDNARFLIWGKGKHADTLGDSTPQNAVVKDDCWYAVHCDYFKRRVEAPDKLRRCGAHQKKTDE